MIRDDDRRILERTLELAALAGRRTAPNPRVGAVLVGPDGQVRGEGWHRRAGEAHAEVIALEAAGPAAQGGTLYTSLEPCAHRGRTPPCTDAILARGVRRVVVALVDPDPRVAGEGIGALRRGSVEVDVAAGALASQAEQLNEDYLVHRRRGRAFAALKVAATLDGRIADRHGASRWITGEAARFRGKELRGRCGAVLVGAGTIRADDPELAPPPESAPAPPFLRCVLDGRLSVSPGARIFRRSDEHPVILFTSPGAPGARREALSAAGATIVELGPPGGLVPPGEVLADLARRGVLGVLIEGGGRTSGAFLAAGLVDKLYWFLAPKLLADPEACAAAAAGERVLAAAIQWRVLLEERLGGDILLVLHPGSDGAAKTCLPA